MLMKKLNELDTFDWSIGGVAAICREPEYTHLSHKIKGRPVNGFLHVISGKIECRFDNQTLILNENSFSYFPKGSKHEIFLFGNPVFQRIDFTMTDGESGDKIIFTERPILLYEQTPGHIDEMLKQLCDIYGTHAIGSTAKCISNISFIIAEIAADAAKIGEPVLNIAIRYINDHLNENFTIEQLSALCNISSAHFRRLFKSRFGMTPVKYKNFLRISKSKIMLRRSSLSTAEISDFLGFENEYYFSRVFKELTGISPGAFRNQK